MGKPVLISIKPQHTKNLFSGKKLYEYRKSFPKDVCCLVIYETSPTQKIVGIIHSKDVLKGTPQEIWQKTKNASGVSSENFFKYFEGNTQAVAIEVSNIERIDPIPLSSLDSNLRPPQSYQYLSEDLFDRIRR